MRLPKFKFVGRISNMGENLVVWIPKEFHEKVTGLGLKGKQVRIVIDDEI
jgi:hypothetical protein